MEALAAIVVAVVEVEVEVAEEVEEIGGGGEAGVLEVAKAAVEVEVPPVADVAGATSVSGRRTFQQSTLSNSRRKGTEWSPSSRPRKTTRLSSLFVRVFNSVKTLVFTVLFRRSWMGNNRSTRCGASQLFRRSLAQGYHL